jgi:hypothetical protein
MQKYIVLLFLGLFFITTNASNLTIQPRFTNSFRFTSSDVWNIDVQFTGTSNLNAYLTATITMGGRAVCTLKSGTVALAPGVQSFTTVNITTAQLSYQSQAIGDIENITGSYPSGTYKVCYNAYCLTANCDGQGSNALYNEYPECFEFIVEPPTPLLLAFPEDKAELDWRRPTFNWIPPMPLGTVPGFNYDFTLVEADKNQSCPDAVTRNRPLYKQNGIGQPTLPYPAELDDLDTGKTYCWKVDGLVEDVPVAQSEVWEFKLKTPEIKKRGKTIVQLQYSGRESALPYVLKMDDTMVLRYSQEYNGSEADWEILLETLDHSQSINLDEQTLTAKYNGTGELIFIVEDIVGLKVNTIYSISIVSEKHEVLTARVVLENE